MVSVFKSKIFELHTTRSWDFMGLTLDDGGATPLQLAFGKDVIVGIFDSGSTDLFFFHVPIDFL